MGLRGRRPETAEMQALKGNPSHKKKRRPSIKPTGELIAPAYLTGDARQCFDMIVASQPPGTYASVDAGGLAVFCVAWADHKRATEALASSPPIVPGSTGNATTNPWFAIRSAAARIMMSMGDRLGLDPKSRASLVPAAKKPASKFGTLIGRSGATE